MTQVATGNMTAMQAVYIAAVKGTKASVKTYGQLMVTDHTKAQAELEGVAADVDFNLPDTIDTEHKVLMQYLNTVSGYSFDTAYMNSQVKDHQKTLSIFSGK